MSMPSSASAICWCIMNPIRYPELQIVATPSRRTGGGTFAGFARRATAPKEQDLTSPGCEPRVRSQPLFKPRRAGLRVNREVQFCSLGAVFTNTSQPRVRLRGGGPAGPSGLGLPGPRYPGFTPRAGQILLLRSDGRRCCTPVLDVALALRCHGVVAPEDGMKYPNFACRFGLPLSVLDGYLTARPSLSERRDS